ncbi:UNVERIFIED_CONTAM: hypothetical protein RMT77_006763 [Armadillidium vulgare]
MPLFRTLQINKIKWSICSCYKLNAFSSSSHKKDTFPKNIIFFGNDYFSLTSLKSLYKKKEEGVIEKLHVITHLTKPDTPVATFCMEMNIHYSKWPIDVSLHGYDIGVVVSFGHLIPENIIKSFPLGILNVHGSLLPRWRGSNPVVHAILNGDKETGVTIMNIHPFKFDVGDIVYQEKIKIEENMKSKELTHILSEVGAKCLLYCLGNISLLKRSETQSNIGITKAPKVRPEFSEILWDAMSPRIISLMFRALDDYYPLWSSWHGKNVQLLDLFSVSIDRDCTEDFIEELTKYEFIKKLKKMNVKRKRETLEKEIEFHKRSHVVAGQIIYIKQNGVLRVKCLNGFVDFKSIKVTGKKKMSALDFYNGFMSKVPYTKHYFY